MVLYVVKQAIPTHERSALDGSELQVANGLTGALVPHARRLPLPKPFENGGLQAGLGLRVGAISADSSP